MSVNVVNITIEQGEDFSKTYTIKNNDGTLANLENYTALATLKKYPESTIGHSFTVELNEIQAVLRLSFSKTTTSILKSGRYYYDVFLVAPDETRKKYFEGNAIVKGSATLP
jgi:hypothetical protein